MSIAAEIGRNLLNPIYMRKANAREVNTLISCSALETEHPEQQLSLYKHVASQSMALNIMHQRVKMHMGEDLQFSPPLFMWLSSLVDRPGSAILMVALIKAAVEDGTPLEMFPFLAKYMAEAVPSAESYTLAWRAQKMSPEWFKRGDFPQLGPDNVLDYDAVWA